MACTTNSLMKASSMATNSCIISLPSLFTTKPNSFSCPYHPIPLKPIKLQLSCSHSQLLSLRRRGAHLPALVSAVQGEDNTVVLDEQAQEQGFGQDFGWENQAEQSESEGEGGGSEEEDEEGAVEAVGDAGESDGSFEADGEYQEPSEDAKLFVGNLPYDVDSASLAQLFEQAGTVEIAEVIYNRATDQSRGFGFVTMSTVEEAEKAVELFNRYDLNGRFLAVNKAAPRGSRPERAPRVFETNTRIYVGNLPWSVDDERLEQIFSEYGKVVSARVICERETGRSRGFGFVILSSEAETNDAISNLDGKNIDGRTIRVNIAEERPRRGF